jgi:hypothetical protein
MSVGRETRPVLVLPGRSPASVAREVRQRLQASPLCEACHTEDSVIVRRDRGRIRVLCRECARGEALPRQPSTPADPRMMLKLLELRARPGR